MKASTEKRKHEEETNDRQKKYKTPEWTLEIHHIDVGGNGDATLILARYDGEIKKSVLIDGGEGKKKDKNFVHPYIKKQRVSKLDIMIVTHYDTDHFNGITGLLDNSNNIFNYPGKKDIEIYKDTLVYDPVVPAYNETYFKRMWAMNNAAENQWQKLGNGAKSSQEYLPVLKTKDPWNGDNGRYGMSDYERYVWAIENYHKGKRKTAEVNHDIDKKDYGELGITELKDPAWLVGQEIMWGGMDKVPAAPHMRCIAANEYVLTTNDNKEHVPSNGSGGIDAKNSMSLAFVIEFNKFRYYIGGDIETPQEAKIAEYLNPSDTIGQRVIAMKASHHGAETATSTAFIKRMMPSAVFISNGFNNQFFHPRKRVVDDLEKTEFGNQNNLQKVDYYYLTGFPNCEGSNERKCKNIDNFVLQLTNNSARNRPIDLFSYWRSSYTAFACAGKAYIAELKGNRWKWRINKKKTYPAELPGGNIVLYVNEDQSKQSVEPTEKSKNLKTMFDVQYFGYDPNSSSYKDICFPHEI